MSKERLYLFDTGLRDGAQTQINPFAISQTDKLIDRKTACLLVSGGRS
jgi:isopropylmalate/homocitrate/citramalate synthase